MLNFSLLCYSESFNFTRKPAKPTVVVEGLNNTQVELVWNFTFNASFGITIRRVRTDGSGNIQIASRSSSDSVFRNVHADYEANLFATLVIKSATRNDEFEYIFTVLNSGFGEELRDEVNVNVLCKYRNFWCAFLVPSF